MKKTATLFLFVATLLGAATIHYGWGEKVLPGLWVDTHKEAVRARTEEFLESLAENDLDRCVEMTDPTFVLEQGQFRLRSRIAVLMVLTDVMEFATDALQLSDVELGEVQLAEDHQSATIALRVRARSVSSPEQTWTWVRVENEWYFLPQ